MSKSVTVDVEFALRSLSLACTALATTLNIGMTVASMRPVWSYGQSYYWYEYHPITVFPFAFITLFFTAVVHTAALIHRRRNGHMPGRKYAVYDGLCFVFWVTILSTTWALEIRRLLAPGYALLAGYTTAPEIVIMFIHLFFFIYNIRGFYTSITAGFAVHHCPNCRSEVVIGQTQQSQTTDRAGANYSLLRGEDYLDADADAVPYADARDSEEQMRPEADDKAEKESKGKGIIEV